jgi:hypothetical protein
MLARWFLRLWFLSSLTVHDAIVVHITTATTAKECYRYIRQLEILGDLSSNYN